jgi:phage/plasmid-associated DNA primase
VVEFIINALKNKGVSYRIVGDYHYIILNGEPIELEKPIWKKCNSHQQALIRTGLTPEEIAILRTEVHQAYQDNKKRIKETSQPNECELYDDKEHILYPRLADLMVSKLKIYRWSGGYWLKQGHVYKPLMPDDLAAAALTALKAQGEPRDWGATSTGRILSFFPAISPELAGRPPEYLLFTATDVMDLRTGEIVTPDKDYAAIYYSPVKFDPDARCDRISKMLKEIFTPEQEKAFLSFSGPDWAVGRCSTKFFLQERVARAKANSGH